MARVFASDKFPTAAFAVMLHFAGVVLPVGIDNCCDLICGVEAIFEEATAFPTSLTEGVGFDVLNPIVCCSKSSAFDANSGEIEVEVVDTGGAFCC